MPFDDETIEVLIAGYLSRDAAHEDFESVQRDGGYLHGATVIGKDLEGNISAEQTDHLVRQTATGMGTAGFLLGLVVPPLLPTTTALGAGMGAGMGMLLHHFTANELKERAGTTVPIGGAALIVAYPRSSAETVRPAVKRAISTTIGQARGYRPKALAGALADAQRNIATTDA